MWLLLFFGAAVLPSVYAEHDEVAGLHGIDNCVPTWNLVGNISHNDVLETPCVPNVDGSGCRHGERVAMNQDGTHIAMSAPNARDLVYADDVIGYVAVFQNVNGGWQMVGDVILGHIPVGYNEHDPIHFGSSVALSNDGKTVIIGAKKDRRQFSENPESGYFVVYEFDDISISWEPKGNFNDLFETTEGSGAYDAWGTSVAINGAGNVIAAAGVKSHSALLGATDSGMVAVYEYYGGLWSQVGSFLNNGDNSLSQYGFGLDLSKDGYTVAIGAPGINKVEVWYMDYDIGDFGDWAQIHETIYGAANSQTGYNVRLNADATFLVVSSVSETFGGNANAGVVRAYLDSGEWYLLETFGGESENAYFGTGLDVNDAGLKIAIGAPGAEHGYVEVYEEDEEDGSVWNLLTRQNGNASAYTDDSEYGFTVAMSGTEHIIVVGSVGMGAVHVHSFIEGGSPCGEHGTCSDSHDAYICDCNAGWAGAQCDQHDYCYGNLNYCYDQSECVSGVDSYVCNCNPGWTGEYCGDSVNDCGGNACTNGATCVDGHLGYTCTCVTGWEGQHCSSSVNECIGNACTNGATCVDGHLGYTCTCLDGWKGQYCGDSIDDCVNDNMCNFGDCVDEHMATSCNCWPGYEDIYCSTNIDDCQSHDCLNSGTCVDGNQSFTCQCTSEWEGEKCTNLIDQCESPCVNGGQCIEGETNHVCNCTTEWAGPTCAKPNYCNSHTCVNGQCVDGETSFTCNCADGWEGSNCDNNIDDCAVSPCKNSGTCTDGIYTYSCNCATSTVNSAGVSGWTGPTCEDNVDECTLETDNCDINAVCIDEDGYFRCVCGAPNWHGDGVTCTSTIPCQKGTTAHFSTIACVNGDAIGYAGECTCSCTTGWTGDFCQNDVDECTLETDNCDNNANCVNTDGDFTCTCNTNYNGDGLNCTMIDCEIGSTSDDWTIDCVHGTATGKAGECTCSCTTEWTGDFCQNDVDECTLETDNCDNNANCVNTDGDFTCTCNTNYNGDGLNCTMIDCEIGSTSDDWTIDCVHGTATGKAAECTCSCTTGWTGDFCQNDVDECASEPCDNNANCVNTDGDFTCTCNTNYNGDGSNCTMIDCEIGSTSDDWTIDCVHGTATGKAGECKCDCVTGWQGNLCAKLADVELLSKWYDWTYALYLAFVAVLAFFAVCGTRKYTVEEKISRFFLNEKNKMKKMQHGNLRYIVIKS